MFYIRTEENPASAERALKRGRSVRRWGFAGADLRDHLRDDLDGADQYDAVRELATLFDYDFPREATPEDLGEALHELSYILIPGSEEERQAAQRLGYEPYKSGYARFLDGLCALQEFGQEPSPEDLNTDLGGDLFRYLVCYEGEPVGWDDADEGWPLFRPTRIVWVYDRGPDAPSAGRERLF